MLAAKKCCTSMSKEKSKMGTIPKKTDNIRFKNPETILLQHYFSIMKTARAASVVFQSLSGEIFLLPLIDSGDPSLSVEAEHG